MERTIAFLLLLVLVHYSSGLRLGQRGGATQGIALWGALEPTSNAEQHRRALNRGLGATAFLGALMTATCAGHAAEEAAIFRDAKNGFQLTVPEGFVTLPPRKVSQGEVSVGMPEDTLFLSQNFALGGTISVTRSNTQRLLADFGIPWASSRAIRSIGDVGNI
ncbi:hypothetical protein B484DRAFT_69703 [Ochromonadaceae sp. CCMP2298]|nr:hypothetical protein B484DRAFT_69703 [Ochromonadaceae sp. CCMP2298]